MNSSPFVTKLWRLILVGLALLLAYTHAYANDNFNASTGVVTVPVVKVGTTFYWNVTLTLSSVISVGQAPAYSNYDTFNTTNGQLTIPSVTVNGTEYNNVVATIDKVLGAEGGWQPDATLVAAGTVAAYDGVTRLINLPVLQVGSTTYNNASVSIGTIVGLGATNAALNINSLNTANNQLTIPLVIVGSVAYRNVVITLGAITCTANQSLHSGTCVTAVTRLSGFVAAGGFVNADVLVYDASTYSKSATNTPIATTTTGADGSYAVDLPVGFSHSALIIVRSRSDGASTFKDAILGSTAIPSSGTALSIQSVVPRSDIAGISGTVTANVNAFTNLAAAVVSNKLGTSDIDAAISTAKTNVSGKLTAGADPFKAVKNDASMTVLLASVSSIATVKSGTSTTDPFNCAVKPTTFDKLACTEKTLQGALQPMAATANPSTAPAVNFNNVAALSSSVASLDVAALSTASGVTASSLSSSRGSIDTTLKSTSKDAALTDKAVSSLQLDTGVGLIFYPQILIHTDRVQGLTDTTSGWRYSLWICDTGCVDRGPTQLGAAVFESDADRLWADQNGQPTAAKIASDVGKRMGEIYSDLAKIKANPTIDQIIRAFSVGVDAGIAAQSPDAGVAETRNEFVKAGFAIPTTGKSGSAVVATPVQVDAAKTCSQNSSYDNPDSVPYDPQFDSFCRLAQFDQCVHDQAQITTYDPEGRSTCQLLQGLIDATPGTWSCKYCPGGKFRY